MQKATFEKIGLLSQVQLVKFSLNLDICKLSINITYFRQALGDNMTSIRGTAIAQWIRLCLPSCGAGFKP